MLSTQLEGRCAGRTCRAVSGRRPPRTWRGGGSSGRVAWGAPRRAAPLPPTAAFRAFFRPRPVLASDPIPRGVSDPGHGQSRPFPCWRPLLPLSFPFLSGPAHPRGREMARGWEGGGNLSPPPLPKSTTELLSADEPGLPLANSGGLCSPQLFPGHLTCQLLGGRCC